VQLLNGDIANYIYDAFGRRIEKSVGADTRRYVYDRQALVLEYDGTNQLLAQYSHGERIDQPLSMRRNGVSYFYHPDHQSSVVALTDPTGQVVNAYEYDSYGNRLVALEAVENPFEYTGREFDDETGLYFYRNRYYDPLTGRFIQEDPLAFGSGDLNLYRYVLNNPVNRIDPFGLQDTVEELIVPATTLVAIAGTGIALAVLFQSIDFDISLALPSSISGSGGGGDSNAGPSDQSGEPGADAPAPAGANDGAPPAASDAESGPTADNPSNNPAAVVETKDLKKLGQGLIDKLKENDINPEELKKGVQGGGRQDLYSDRDGNIYVGNKDGTGEAEWTGLNIKNL
jgi:RHS repeat-associated protein